MPHDFARTPAEAARKAGLGHPPAKVEHDAREQPRATEHSRRRGGTERWRSRARATNRSDGTASRFENANRTHDGGPTHVQPGNRTGTIEALHRPRRARTTRVRSLVENGDMVVARLEDQVTLKRYVRKDERRIELHPESTNPDHRPIRIDFKLDPFEIAGVAVGALIGDGFNRPSYEDWPA